LSHAASGGDFAAALDLGMTTTKQFCGQNDTLIQKQLERGRGPVVGLETHFV
jgi:hypothetical protein